MVGSLKSLQDLLIHIELSRPASALLVVGISPTLSSPPIARSDLFDTYISSLDFLSSGTNLEVKEVLVAGGRSVAVERGLALMPPTCTRAPFLFRWRDDRSRGAPVLLGASRHGRKMRAR